MTKIEKAAILKNKNYHEDSVFLPENLLREARRQKNTADCSVPSVCVLDPDGDLATYLIENSQASKNDCWSCYHSALYNFTLDDKKVGVIPYVVGASYAVLVAEQLFVSGCQLLISITSAGIINESKVKRQFALITEAVRDEGTSYHYLPQNSLSTLSNELKSRLADCKLWFQAKSWTTDAPYRETPSAIKAIKNEHVTCVEMEASALYAFAETKNQSMVCFAHLTNTMAQEEGDFEKGEFSGSLSSLALLRNVISKID